MQKVFKHGSILLAMFLHGFLFCPKTYAVCDATIPLFCNPLDTGGNGIDTIAEAIIVVMQFLLSIIGILSLLFIVIAGIRYIISSGDEEKITAAKGTLTSSVFGLVLALVAFQILSEIEDILTVN
jgi:hypothetical protein